MPTLADILGYQKDDETSEKNILSYLFDILGEHYGETAGGRGEGKYRQYTGIEQAETSSDEFLKLASYENRGLSEAELADYISGFEDLGEWDEGEWGIQEAGQKFRNPGEPTGYTRLNPGKFWTGQKLAKEYDISDWQNLSAEEFNHYFPHWSGTEGIGQTDFMRTLQDAFKAVPSAEKWGLDRKIGDIEASSERGIGSAREDYVQSELQRRYGGKKLDEKDMLERASYESDVYGLQRQVGRKRRGLQRDYEEDWYGGISNLMKNLG